MADKIITTYLDERKYQTLKKALEEKGENIEDEMHTLVETFYETTVSLEEQERIEQQIEQDLIGEHSPDSQEEGVQTDEEDAPVMQM